jgi:hypothetical protein
LHFCLQNPQNSLQVSQRQDKQPGQPIKLFLEVTYWYGNSLSNNMEGALPDGSNPQMMRRGSEAVTNSHLLHR